MENYMKKEKMLTLDLIGHGLDYRFDVPESEFLDLVKLAPQILECHELEENKIRYSHILEIIKSTSPYMSDISWDSGVNETQLFLRMCLMIAVIGGLLQDIPLMICSNNAAEMIQELGGIDVTDEVESGALPFLSSKEINSFKQRCSQ